VNRLLRQTAWSTAIATAGLLVAVPAAGASGASGSSPPDHPRPAVVSPLISSFSFGAYVGGVLVCGVMGGSISSVASIVPNGARQFGPVATQLSAGCVDVSQRGSAGLDQLNASAAPLAVMNPYANQSIDAFADAMARAGKDFGPSIAPFGPTVVQMADAVRFFKGS